MQKVRCYDCGRGYDYDEDSFCPNCGAFNQPLRSLRIGADGSVVRVDGLNEANHANSFVHQELHEEKRERRRVGLDKGVQRIQRTAARTAPARPVPSAPVSSRTGRRSQQHKSNPLTIVVWIIIMIMIINILPRILFFF